MEAIWSSEQGTIILGPEEEGAPVAQLIINTGPPVVMGDGMQWLPVASATLSITARRVGALAPDEAELYELIPDKLPCPHVRVLERGPNYLAADFCLLMAEIPQLVGGLVVEEGETTLELWGEFVALEL